jgi:hypothetical protein
MFPHRQFGAAGTPSASGPFLFPARAFDTAARLRNPCALVRRAVRHWAAMAGNDLAGELPPAPR